MCLSKDILYTMKLLLFPTNTIYKGGGGAGKRIVRISTPARQWKTGSETCLAKNLLRPTAAPDLSGEPCSRTTEPVCQYSLAPSVVFGPNVEINTSWSDSWDKVQCRITQLRHKGRGMLLTDRAILYHRK